jgi:hypothetical protein
MDASAHVRNQPSSVTRLCEERRVARDAAGTINTIAGTGVAGYSGDGGPATKAQIDMPEGLALDAAGNLFIGDSGNKRA